MKLKNFKPSDNHFIQLALAQTVIKITTTSFCIVQEEKMDYYQCRIKYIELEILKEKLQQHRALQVAIEKRKAEEKDFCMEQQSFRNNYLEREILYQIEKIMGES